MTPVPQDLLDLILERCFEVLRPDPRDTGGGGAT